MDRRTNLKRLLFLWIACVGILAGRPARADIIFIDLRRSALEIQSAREAAAIRGEKLVVIPPEYAAADKVKVDALQKQYDALDKKYQAITPSDHELMLAVYAKKAEMDDIRKKYFWTPALLDQAITAIEKQGRAVTSLIVSGHSDGTSFWGPLADTGTVNELHRDQLLEVYAKHPKSKLTTHSVFLWGCHSGEMEPINWWRKKFPDVNVLGGFSGTAPLNTTAQSHTLLKDILIKESVLAKENDLKQVKTTLTQLNDALLTPAVVMANNCYVGTPMSEVKSIKFGDPQAAGCSPKDLSELEKELPVFQNYMAAADDAHAKLPNTRTSPLRDFYNALQKNAHCPGLFKRLSTKLGYPITLETVVALIHFDIIQKNFEYYYNELGPLGKDRRSVLKKISGPGFGGNHDQAVLAAQKILKNLQCVPKTWITENPPASGPIDAPDGACLFQ